MDTSDVVLITGASSGVGRSLTRYLAGRFRVLAAVRDPGKMKDEFATSPAVTVYEVDLSRADSVAGFLDRVTEDHRFIPYVINNAGVNIGAHTTESTDASDLELSMQVNAFSPAMIMKRLLGPMKRHDFGRIINMTSGAPLNCFPGYGAYSASKGALNALTVTAARECEAQNIKINLMSPGPVRTNMAPNAPMDPSVAHPTADYLLSLDSDGPTGRFFWLGYEIPLFPHLEGIEWLEGRADERYHKVF